MLIGPYTFPGRFFLAPLAGVSDRPFRAICRAMGASFAYTEMVSRPRARPRRRSRPRATSIASRTRTRSRSRSSPSEPDVLARGAEVAVRAGAGIIDVNMACPVKKVCGTGAGAALGRDPRRVEEAVRAIRDAVAVPVTVKIRAGWDDAEVNCVEVARAAEAGGAAAVALHGPDPLAALLGPGALGAGACGEGGGLDPRARLGRRLDRRRRAPDARGDGCDAVLVARGACGNPWIFRELRAAERGLPRPPPPTRDEWVGTVLQHVRLQVEHRARQRPQRGPARRRSAQAIRELRKHLFWYTRGRRGGVHFRRDAAQAPDGGGRRAGDRGALPARRRELRARSGVPPRRGGGVKLGVWSPRTAPGGRGASSARRDDRAHPRGAAVRGSQKRM